MNILERIKKLLRLAQNAGSEQEATLAAQRAAQLMAQHEIHEASINLDGPDEVRATEEIVEDFKVTHTRKRVAWHIRIASAVAESYGAESYTENGSLKFFGRLSAVQAASYTTQFLIRKVEEITDQKAPSDLFARRYRNGFRLGCASRIGARIREQTETEKRNFGKRRKDAERFEANAASRAKRERFDTSDVTGADDVVDPADVSTPPASAGVLARVERERDEVKQAYKKYSKEWKSSRGVGTVTSSSGYDAGSEAGDRVKLTTRVRGGLPRGQDVLK